MFHRYNAHPRRYRVAAAAALVIGLTVVGTATPVVPQVRTTSFGAVDAALARDGTLVYVTGGAGSGTERTLVWVDRQGRETPLAAPPRAYYFPRVSPAGTQIAVNSSPSTSGIQVTSGHW